MEAVEVLQHLGGAADRADILRQCNRWSLEQAGKRGEIEKTARGRYSLPNLEPALKVAAFLRGEVSHASAASHWMLEAIREPSAVHITVPPQAHRRPEKSVTLHYAELDGERVTPPLRTVLDCARTMPFRDALAIADSALRRELLTPYELVAGADLLKGPGSKQARRVAGLADARAANPFESALRAAVYDLGEKSFVPQLFIPSPGYRVDLGDPERMIILEADSFTFHGTATALERDCRRYDELVRRGWLVLRFAWNQVMFEEAWVSAVIADTCRLRNNQRGGATGRAELTDAGAIR